MTSDGEYLNSYLRKNSQEAFEELVNRYLDPVYSSALRQLAGDGSLAEEVTQQVFVDLSQKARELQDRDNLAGWLFTHTRFRCLNVIRTEQRRRIREEKAHTMHMETTQSAEDHWAEIGPVLDDVLAELPAPDREALLMRFFRKKNLAQIGEEIGGSSEAARKRIGRALDKLRVALKQRGIAVPATALSLLLTENVVVAAPASLAAGVVGAAATQVTSTTLLGTIQIMTTKAKLITAVAVAAGVATPIVLQQKSLNQLKEQNAVLTEQVAQLGELDSLRDEVARLSEYEKSQSDLDRAREEQLELMELRGQVGALREQKNQLDDQVGALKKTNERLAANASAAQALDESEDETEEWISAAARLRALRFAGKPLSEEEVKWLEDAKPIIEQMERDPKQFSEFQTELIRETVPSLDTERTAQIEKIIADTYEQAVAQGLDIPSKPVDDNEDWVKHRHELDRAGTEAVQNLLTEEERRLFDFKFLGVMGVDLGTGVDHSNYPPGFLGTAADLQNIQGQTTDGVNIAGEVIVLPDGTVEIVPK